MAWQRIQREGTCKSLIIKITKEGPMPYNQAEKYIMKLHMLSRLTAKRYLEDLVYSEELTMIKGDLLDIPNRTPPTGTVKK
jgi:hypothetical protein